MTEGYIQWRYEGGTWSNLLDLSTLTGAAGQDGADGQDGQDGADGQDGQDGADGQDGVTPQLRINAETNQWEVSYDNGTTWDSLGVSATGPAGQDGQDGQDGQTPVIGSNGNWWIGTTDTGISAMPKHQWHRPLQWQRLKKGEDGADGVDGLTPFIGSNGNWWIGSTDTGIPSTGADGQDGQDGQNGQNGAGIADVQINDNGELIVTLTDGTELNSQRGVDGGNGRSHGPGGHFQSENHGICGPGHGGGFAGRPDCNAGVPAGQAQDPPSGSDRPI